MTASLDREQILLGRISTEIPAFCENIHSATFDDLAAQRQLVADAMELIRAGNALELASMRDYLSVYDTELRALQEQSMIEAGIEA